MFGQDADYRIVHFLHVKLVQELQYVGLLHGDIALRSVPQVVIRTVDEGLQLSLETVRGLCWHIVTSDASILEEALPIPGVQ